jgi:hypothetical protein
VLCKSPNADDSDWVKFEVKHIKETNRPYEIVDLDWPKDKLTEAIKRFKIRSTVFLSYPRKLIELAKKVNEQLKLHEFRTFFDKNDLMSGEVFISQIRNQIIIAAEKGYVLVFIDENFNENTWQYEEIQMALEVVQTMKSNKSHIVPVITSDIISDLAIFLFGNYHCIEVKYKNNSDAAEYIVNCLIELDIRNYQ